MYLCDQQITDLNLHTLQHSSKFAQSKYKNPQETQISIILQEQERLSLRPCHKTLEETSPLDLNSKQNHHQSV